MFNIASPDSQQDHKAFGISKYGILQFLIWVIILGIALVFIYSLRFVWEDKRASVNVLYVLGAAALGLMAGGASFMIGAFGGFLFAIPKILTNNTASQNPTLSTASIYTHNDNLVQISDWLTKIMVGVGLTQLVHLPEAFNKLGNYFGQSLGNDEVAKNFAVTIVLYFATNGFLISYLWTRLYFIRMLADTDQDIENTRRKYEEEKKKKEELKETMKDMIEVTGFSNDLKKVKLPQYDSDDPQKGKWGGLSENKGMKITAVVTPEFSATLFKIKLQIRSVDPSKPYTGKIKFHLHPTFRNNEPEVMAKNGVAELNLVTYGAFTVGAQTDDGTMLELDLAELPDAPEVFRTR